MYLRLAVIAVFFFCATHAFDFNIEDLPDEFHGTLCPMRTSKTRPVQTLCHRT